jgi:hypothetical protein
LKKWKKGRGYGQNNHLLPPSLTTQNAGDREADRGRGEGRRRPGAQRRSGSGAKRRGGRGQPIPLLTSGWGAPKRRIDGGGRRPVMVVGGGGAWGLGRQGGLVGVVRGEVGSRSGPFIGTGRSVRRGYFELRGAPMAGNGGSGKIPAWTPAGGILSRLAAV